MTRIVKGTVLLFAISLLASGVLMAGEPSNAKDKPTEGCKAAISAEKGGCTAHAAEAADAAAAKCDPKKCDAKKCDPAKCPMHASAKEASGEKAGCAAMATDQKCDPAKCDRTKCDPAKCKQAASAADAAKCPKQDAKGSAEGKSNSDKSST